MAEPKGGLGYIGDNPEAIQSAESALERLSKAYEARNRQFFDPQMLAMAEGFLAPTRSGSFGESLGNAANRLRLAQESQGKQEIENAQGNLAIIQQKAALEQQKRAGEGYKAIEAEFGVGAKPAPTGAPPVGAPVGQTPSDQPQGQPTSSMFNVEIPFAPPSPVDVQAIIAKNKAAGNTNPFLAKLDIQKAQRDNIELKDGYILDRNTGNIKLIPKFGEEDVQAYIPAFGDHPGGNLKVSRGLKNAMDFAAQSGSPAYWDLAKLAVNGPPKPPPPGPQAAGNGIETAPVQKPMVTPLQAERLPPLEGIKNPAPMPAAQPAPTAPTVPAALTPAAPVTPPVSQRRPTIEEAEAAKARREMNLRIEEDRKKAEQKAALERGEIRPRALETQATEQEVKARQEIADNSKEANDTIAYANQFRKYAGLPNAKQMFGILNNQELSSGIAKLITNTVQAGSVKIGMPEIEEVMRNANMNEKEQAQYRSFLQLATQLQLQRAKYMKGSVSNYEQGILGNAGITAQDTPETIRMKADIMAARAQFDRQVARRFKDSKQDAAAFLSSDEYINVMIPEYHARLDRLIAGETRLESKPPSQPRTPAQGSIIPRADALAGIK